MSPRRNQDRTNAPLPDTTSPLSTTGPQDETFSFVVPTEFVDLPSQGKFYGEGHPLHGKTSIEIKHMTAKEEDILTSESLLRKGIAIERLLQSLVVDKSINLADLLVGDKNALIVGARITGYGPSYMTKVGCPACKETQEVDFDLNNLTVRNSSVPAGVERTSENTFFVTLPQSKVQVELGLMTGREERSFVEMNTRKRKKNLQESTATDLLKLLILSVNGSEEPQTINQFIGVMPIGDSRYVRDVYEQISPDVDLNHDFRCLNCDHEGRVGVPLNVDFFWPR
mgnify:FL=1